MTSDETVNTAREELIKELLQRKEQRKKNWNQNIYSVRTNDNLKAKIDHYCKEKQITFNAFFNQLLNNFFK